MTPPLLLPEFSRAQLYSMGRRYLSGQRGSNGQRYLSGQRCVIAGLSLMGLIATVGCSLGQDVPLGGVTPSLESRRFEFDSVRWVTELNSVEGDANPTLSFDLLSICFTSLRSGGTGDEDVWCSRRSSTDVPFDAPTEAAALNTGHFETSAALSPDGLSIWYGSRREGGPGEVDVYTSTRSAFHQPFATPELENTLNSEFDDIPRPLGFGGRYMPVSSRRLEDRYLIYLAEFREESSDFGEPALIAELSDLGRPIVDGFLLEDGLTLLFTMDDPDLETGDIYFVTRPSLGEPFGEPQTIGGVNTEFDERDPWLSPDERVLFFSSDRDGNTDIYEATRVTR